MKRIFTFLFLFLISASFLPAQCYEWRDADLYGGTGSEYVFGMTLSSTDARYICGEFRDTLTLGSTTLIPDDLNGSTPFLFKTDASGNVIWAYTPEYLSASAYMDRFSAVDIDNAGNLYVAAAFEGAPVVMGSDTLQSQFRDSYIIKFDSLGNVIWTTRVGGTGADLVFDLEVDPDGNVLAMGHYTGSMTLDTTSLSSLGSRDIFIVKVDPNGQFLWARNAGSVNPDQAASLAVDPQGNVFLNGTFRGSFYFGNDSLVNASSFYFPFLLKMNGQGDFLWGRTGEGTGTIYVARLACDAWGNALYSGEFRDSIEFSGQRTYSTGSADCFIVKYDAFGNLRFNTSVGTSSADFPRTLLPAPDSTVWYSWSPGSYNNYVGKVTYEHLDASGQSLGQWRGGGGARGEVVEMAYTSDSVIFGAGNCTASLSFTKMVFGSDSLPFVGAGDLFTTYFDTRSLSAGIQTPATDELCAGDSLTLYAQPLPGMSYQWYLNGSAIAGATDSMLVVDSSGSYSVEFIDGICTELSAALTVTVHALPTPVIQQSGNDLSSSLPGVTFAWYLDGNLISGATGSSHTAAQSGDYSFVMTDSNGCTGYSDTMYVNFVGIADDIETAMRVYPQPAKDRVFIELPGEGQAMIGLYDLRGVAVLPARTVHSAGRIELDLSGLAEGVYILRIELGGRLYSRRLLLTNFP